MNTPLTSPALSVKQVGLFDALAALMVITLTATALLVIFALTYWPWMGYMTLAGLTSQPSKLESTHENLNPH